MRNWSKSALLLATLSASLIIPANALAAPGDGVEEGAESWASPVGAPSTRSLSGAQGLCTYFNAGDYPHITNGDVSVHGWWQAGTCKASQKAAVEVKLQVFNGWWWEDLKTGSATVYPEGGAGKRANARYTCKNFSTERAFRTWVKAVPSQQANIAIAAIGPERKLKCG